MRLSHRAAGESRTPSVALGPIPRNGRIMSSMTVELDCQLAWSFPLKVSSGSELLEVEFLSLSLSFGMPLFVVHYGRLYLIHNDRSG